MRNLDLDLLRTLAAIDQAQIFSGAAERLHKTQSAITQQMQRLESLVGLPLFEKQGANKLLSPHGRKLVDYARHMLAINDEAMRAMQDGRLEGELRLGSPHDVADTILPTAADAHHALVAARQAGDPRGSQPFPDECIARGELDLSHLDALRSGVRRRDLCAPRPPPGSASAAYVHDAGAPVPLVLADEPSLFRRLALNALEQARGTVADQLRRAESGRDPGRRAGGPGHHRAQHRVPGPGHAGAGRKATACRRCRTPTTSCGCAATRSTR